MAPVAAAVVPLVDNVVVAVLERLGAADRSGPWLAGKIVGHLIMGTLAVGLGAVMAPAYKRLTAAALLAIAIVVAAAALLSVELPLRLIGPLASAFVLGAAASATFTFRRQRADGMERITPARSLSDERD